MAMPISFIGIHSMVYRLHDRRGEMIPGWLVSIRRQHLFVMQTMASILNDSGFDHTPSVAYTAACSDPT